MRVTVAFLNMEPLGSRIVAGKREEVAIILGSSPQKEGKRKIYHCSDVNYLTTWCSFLWGRDPRIMETS
jgi:hypothetical protein